MTILWRPCPRDWRSRFFKTCAAARPSLSAVSAVTGSTLAVPRTPSVPKIFFGELMIGNRSAFLRHDHVHFLGNDLHVGDAGRCRDFNAFVEAARRFDTRQIHQ